MVKQIPAETEAEQPMQKVMQKGVQKGRGCHEKIAQRKEGYEMRTQKKREARQKY